MDPAIPTPFSEHAETVRSEWIDYNDHMNIGYYLLLFEDAARAFFRWTDLSQTYRERSNHGMFASEGHITFEREVMVGDRLRFETQLLDSRPRALDLIHLMYHAREGYLAATNEVVYLHVDLEHRRAVPFPAVQQALLDRIKKAHSSLPRPPQAGRAIKLR